MASWRILMYSSGLESACCTLAIASHLSYIYPSSSFLIVTDLPFFSRFRLPANLDYVHLPQIPNGLRGLDVPHDTVLGLRRNIILSTIKSFDPHLLIVDRFPLGLTHELQEVLTYLQKSRPQTKTVLGLLDIPGEANVIRAAWNQGGVYETLRAFYHEIWVYGTSQIFDPVREYTIPLDIARKIVYTGYLRRPLKRRALCQQRVNIKQPLVFVAVGGGSNGYRLVDTYLSFLENINNPGQFQSYIACSSFVSSANKHALKLRAARLPGVSLHRFHEDLNPPMDLATLVVSASDYNTCCQILSFRKKAVIIPRPSFTSEQLLRAQVFHRRGVMKMLHPTQLTPESLGQKILEQTSQRQLPTPPEKYQAIPLTGLDNIAHRVRNLCGMFEPRDAVRIAIE